MTTDELITRDGNFIRGRNVCVDCREIVAISAPGGRNGAVVILRGGCQITVDGKARGLLVLGCWQDFLGLTMWAERTASDEARALAVACNERERKLLGDSSHVPGGVLIATKQIIRDVAGDISEIREMKHELKEMA